MDWAIDKKKPFFVGKRAIDVFNKKGLSRQLVGFTLSATSEMPQECNIVVNGEEIVGRVTSVASSPAVENIIGLAYVSPEQSNVGDEFNIKLSNGKLLNATVAKLPFYDPENKRQEL
jgi:sarcosine oxidase subunit alpha